MALGSTPGLRFPGVVSLMRLLVPLRGPVPHPHHVSVRTEPRCLAGCPRRCRPLPCAHSAHARSSAGHARASLAASTSRATAPRTPAAVPWPLGSPALVQAMTAHTPRRTDDSSTLLQRRRSASPRRVSVVARVSCAARRRGDRRGRAFPGSSTPLPPPSAMVFVVLCFWGR